ncbi:hypothetical protein [Clavibacter michiganensis]|uniref:hypothetical protein n=1 Tax=Clavibacter michiganensis TaxID=28447 RepID=UPI000B56E055|nr:hypothetical protein [Clavibacter michiganensis]KAF0258924.1 hypothetical protein DOU02_06070 [Clavibacter michiganensis subsp. michiganensis]MDO4017973.1 hypothetical protein [Clavibacter michiganensis]MDO4028275.1 hypothetical protein [Clavibacter michiganensis]MDO4037696.1 hypothetical protein [Clavibacter michiganensis]MDO4041044.1 hypothetical protein [Clavibacter michiganensis]
MANKIITQLADGLGRSSIVGTGLIVSLSAEGVEHQDNLDRGTAAKPRQAWVPGNGEGRMSASSRRTTAISLQAMKTGDAVKRNDAPAGPGQTRYEGGVGGRAAIELSLACLPHA